MAVHASHAAGAPYPVKGYRFSFAVTMVDADGDPTAATTPDTEISKDNAAAADATEEIVATSGMDGQALMTFTGDETNASIVKAVVKNASGPKFPLITIYPRVLARLASAVDLSAGSAGGGTLATPLTYDITGCYIGTVAGTGAAGGSGKAGNQIRLITSYVIATGVFTVEPDWETTPDNTTDVDIMLPTGVTGQMAKTLNPATAGRTLTIESDGMAHADVKEIEGADATNQIPTTAQIADKVLGRAQQGGSDTSPNLTEALRFLNNKVEIIGTTLTVYEEDGVTPAFTRTIARAAEDAIVSIEP